MSIGLGPTIQGESHSHLQHGESALAFWSALAALREPMLRPDDP